MEVKVFESVTRINDTIANQINKLLTENKTCGFNFISSPGSGKTTIIEKLISNLKSKYRIGVIEGDLATTRDAERVKKYDVPVVQINTGKGCHLDANLIYQTLNEFNLKELDILFIENVGNLICPTSYWLGEHFTIGIMSTPEGDDKPEKYPLILRKAHLLILNKVDLIPYINFNKENFYNSVKKINPQLQIIEMSAIKDHRNFQLLVDWIKEKTDKTIT